MNACAAEHNALGDLGIPRPPRLDPYCGAAALAACLRGLGLASDRRSVLRVCKVTGRGSTMVDLHDACQKMGDAVTGRVIQADEHAIQLTITFRQTLSTLPSLLPIRLESF